MPSFSHQYAAPSSRRHAVQVSTYGALIYPLNPAVYATTRGGLDSRRVLQCGKCHALSCTSRRWSRCRVSPYSLLSAHHIWCDLRTRSCAARHRREPHRCAPYSRTVAVNCRMPACSACCTRAPNTNSEVLPASTLRTRLLPHCGAPALYSATSCGPSGMDSSRRALPAAVPKGGP